MSNNIPTNGITIDQAKNWTEAWQTKHPSLSKAFLIPITDILTLFKELDVLIADGKGGYIVNENNPMDVAIRSYLAIGPSEEKDEIGKNEEKLVLVGAVNVNGEYQDQVEETQNRLQVNLAGSGAFDFTRPCPRYCDKKSPLNHG